MAVASDMKKGKKKGILVAPLRFAGGNFTRADLVFTGVDHSGISYEVLVFLNNRTATDTTAHDVKNGYGGRFVTFGHGGCYGDVGHCDAPAERSADDLRPPHPLTPNTTVVTVTKALQYVLANNAKGLETVTLVPVALTPRPEDSKITPDLFRFDEVVLRTYLSGTETQLDAAPN
jgi:nucleoside-diphosphate-sugar epimerase